MDSKSSIVVAIKILLEFRKRDDASPELARIRVASAREGIYMPMLPQEAANTVFVLFLPISP